MAVERDWERRIGGRLKLRDLHILSKVVEWGSMARAGVTPRHVSASGVGSNR